MPVQGIIAKKVGMTQVYGKDGRAIPATVIHAGPCVVVQRKTSAKEGYEAVQIGFIGIRGRQARPSPSMGHCEKHGMAPPRGCPRAPRGSWRSSEGRGQHPGHSVRREGQVHVTGISKGKGFAGVIKRHHFGGGGRHPRLHVPPRPRLHRRHGLPSARLKGPRADGHMGGETVTARNLEVVEVDAENNLLVVKGAVPGSTGCPRRRCCARRPARCAARADGARRLGALKN